MAVWGPPWAESVRLGGETQLKDGLQQQEEELLDDTVLKRGGASVNPASSLHRETETVDGGGAELGEHYLLSNHRQEEWQIRCFLKSGRTVNQIGQEGKEGRLPSSSSGSCVFFSATILPVAFSLACTPSRTCPPRPSSASHTGPLQP
jgi:hypothetical protein